MIALDMQLLDAGGGLRWNLDGHISETGQFAAGLPGEGKGGYSQGARRLGSQAHIAGVPTGANSQEHIARFR